ncbi:MAG TPA: LysE family translocator [Acetobacteraceae bacterium]|nr:LysE family translocator [Acetobacteraceae bacterium]
MSGEQLVWLASVLTFAFAMSATPGPNNAMLAASGASFGFRRSIPHMLGITLGFPVLILTAALGAAEFLRRTPWLEQTLHWAATAYMLWLAVKIATAKPAADREAASGKPLTFLQAALFQWINPKGWVAALGAVLAYATATGPGLLTQAGVIALVFMLVFIPVAAFWTAVGVGVARFLREPRAVRVFNVVMALLLVASLVPTMGLM